MFYKNYKILLYSVFIAVSSSTTLMSKILYTSGRSTQSQELPCNILILPIKQEELALAKFNSPILPQESQSSCYYTISVNSINNELFEATLFSTQWNNESNSYIVDENSAVFFRETKIASVLAEALTNLEQNSIQIKSIIFGNKNDLFTENTITSEETPTPWVYIPKTEISNVSNVCINLPFSITAFADMLAELKGVYGKKFHTIAVTQAPCSLECAHEINPFTHYLVTTNKPNTKNIPAQKNIQYSQRITIDNEEIQPSRMLPMLFEIINGWFGDTESNNTEITNESTNIKLDEEIPLELSTTAQSIEYNCIDCRKTTLITRNIGKILNNIFGLPDFIENASVQKNGISLLSGLDQMTLKRTGELFFENFKNNASSVNNYQINASLLCAIIAKTVEDRLEALAPSMPKIQYKNIYMKNKNIIPLLTTIKALAEETEKIIRDATLKGSCSLFIAFPEEILDADFPHSQFLSETRIDRLYVLLQLYLLAEAEQYL